MAIDFYQPATTAPENIRPHKVMVTIYTDQMEALAWWHPMVGALLSEYSEYFVSDQRIPRVIQDDYGTPMASITIE